MNRQDQKLSNLAKKNRERIKQVKRMNEAKNQAKGPRRVAESKNAKQNQ